MSNHLNRFFLLALLALNTCVLFGQHTEGNMQEILSIDESKSEFPIADTTNNINLQPIHHVKLNKDNGITYMEYSVNTDTLIYKTIYDSTLYSDNWDSLPQTIFWRKIMQLPPDTALASVASTRRIITGFASVEYDTLEKNQKITYKDAIKAKHNLPADEKIYVTFGKKDFYNIYGILPQIDSAIRIFIDNGADPFYAQAVLLIESPNRLEYSWAGAYGPFQLMKTIALQYGLTVNKEVDERANLQKAAKVTALYFKNFCVPEIKKILEKKNIHYSESDLWFKLLVLHVYHAGLGNVQGVIEKLNPNKGGVDLITQIWQTEYKSFKNASQNYSQVALAAMLELYNLLTKNSTNTPTL